MKIILTIFLLSSIFILTSEAQVSGVSGSKVNAVNAAPIFRHTVEFEPVIETGWSKRRWNDNWRREDLFSSPDSTSRFTSMSYRITYGISEDLEAGVNITGDFEMISFAFKKRFIDNEILGVSFLGGFNYVAGNGIYNLDKIRHMHSAIVAGISASYSASERFSLDVDLQFEPGIKNIRTLNDYSHFYINSDAGWYINDDLQLVGGFSFSHLVSNNEDKPEGANIFKLNPGFTVEKGRNFILVGGIPFCVAGRNYECTTGLLLALTILID